MSVPSGLPDLLQAEEWTSCSKLTTTITNTEVMMKQIVWALLILVLGSALLTMGAFAQHKYVGVKVCGPCHKTTTSGDQLGIWQKSAHANAYKTLLTAKADEIARKQGLKTAAKDSPECLSCHVTGYGKDKSLFMPTFNMQDGVQCEACHGPGSDYKTLSVMKDPKLAEAKGLILAKDDPKLCEECHNKKSPTFKGFDYKKYWAKIAHPVPQKKS